MNIAGRDGLPLLLDVSWEPSSSTSEGGQEPDLRVGCPRRALGSSRRAGLFELGARRTSFPCHGEEQSNARVQAAAALCPGIPIDCLLCLPMLRMVTPACRLKSIRQDSSIKGNIKMYIFEGGAGSFYGQGKQGSSSLVARRAVLCACLLGGSRCASRGRGTAAQG